MLHVILQKYKDTIDIIESSANPKTQLHAIIEFFKEIESENLRHLVDKFIPDFILPLINIYRNAAVSFIDPEILVVSRYLFLKALSIDIDANTKEGIKEIINELNIRLLLVYYYLGEIENGKKVLEDILRNNSLPNTGFDLNTDFKHKEQNKNKATSTALSNPQLFRVGIIFNILHRINYELSRVNSYYSESVNVLLVESDLVYTNIRKFGLVMELLCDIEKSTTTNNDILHLDNIVDVHSIQLTSIKEGILNNLQNILRHFDTDPSRFKHKIHLRFYDLKSIYTGSSFGAGVSILIPASMLNFNKTRKKYSINASAAFTGSLDSDGKLIRLPHEVVSPKIEAACFSWIRYLIVPKDNLAEVNNVLSPLLKKYPRKEITIIPVENITELLSYPEIIKIEEDSVFKHSYNVLKRHQYATYSMISIFLILLTSIIVWNAIPRNFKPLPQSQSYLNLFYTPDRDTNWIFQNSDRVGGDTITFGEIAIGDMLTHRVTLWNNADEKQPIRLELAGRNKDEFEVLWAIDPAQKESPEYTLNDLRQRIYLKFIPWKEPGEKEATLIAYSEKYPEIVKKIYLRGKSEFFKHGYSLKMKNDDEYVINPKQGNFLQDEFTIMFWFKTNKPNIRLINDDNTNHSDSKFSLLVDYDTTIGMHVLESGALQTYSHKIVSKNRVKLNEWNSLAVSHNRNVTTLYLNNQSTVYKSENSHLKQIEDFFFLGSEVHPMQRGNNIYRKDDWQLYLAELRVFKKELKQNEINSELIQQCSYVDDRLRLYHNFEETVGHFVQDASKNDIPGELFGLPEKSLNHPNIKRLTETPLHNTNVDNYLKVYNKGEIRLNKNIFSSRSSFTLQLQAKAGGNLKKNSRKLFHISGIQYTYGFGFDSSGFIIIEREDFINDNSLELAKIQYHLDSNWHKYTFDYNRDLNKGRLFIDSELKAEYSMGKSDYDITRQFFCIIFGKEGQYDNPRFWGEACSIDNIALFERTLSGGEINFGAPEQLKSIPGILALWTFSKITDNVCFDEINRVPVFVWDEYQILEK